MKKFFSKPLSPGLFIAGVGIISALLILLLIQQGKKETNQSTFIPLAPSGSSYVYTPPSNDWARQNYVYGAVFLYAQSQRLLNQNSDIAQRDAFLSYSMFRVLTELSIYGIRLPLRLDNPDEEKNVAQLRRIKEYADAQLQNKNVNNIWASLPCPDLPAEFLDFQFLYTTFVDNDECGLSYMLLAVFPDRKTAYLCYAKRDGIPY